MPWKIFNAFQWSGQSKYAQWELKTDPHPKSALPALSVYNWRSVVKAFSRNETDQEISYGGEYIFSVKEFEDRCQAPCTCSFIYCFRLLKRLRVNIPELHVVSIKRLSKNFGKCSRRNVFIYMCTFLNIRIVLLCKCTINNKTIWNF